jgi:hypothetical protein
MPHVVIRFVHRCDSDTNANTESPAYAWPDLIHKGVELDDAMQLQMFETYVSSNSEIRAYDCHIAPEGKYPIYAKELVYRSWRFMTTLMV